MGFSNKRGRSRLTQDKTNIFTKELAAKHKGLTKEPLDIFLSKGILNNIERQADHYLRT
ncbi:MAG: hypothetical protein AB8U25_05225 [Rickettsiales endosymbiont of Dermacentor nuttalli]